MDPIRRSSVVVRARLEELERRDTPTFLGLSPFTAGVAVPAVIATADFNGDGLMDVAVGNSTGSVVSAPWSG